MRQVEETMTHPLIAIMRYEMLMGWRRMSLRVLLVTMLVMPVALYFVIWREGGIINTWLTRAPDVGYELRTGFMMVSSFFMIPVIIFLLPMLFAENIPLDKQYKVREIIDVQPITPSTYLAGKMFSVWSATLAVMLLVVLLGGGFIWLMRGEFFLGLVLPFWLLVLIPLALFSSQSGVMLAAGCETRRSAVLLGLVASFLSIIAGVNLSLAEYMRAGIRYIDTWSTNATIDPEAGAALAISLAITGALKLAIIILSMIIMWTVSTLSLEIKQKTN